MTDDVSTLPAWPERLTYPVKAHEVIPFWVAEADAALARMEALVEVVREYVNILDYKGIPHDHDALLAACARKEAGR